MLLSENEFKEWQQHPATKVLIEWLEAKRAEIREQWELGNYTADTCEKTAMLNASALGIAEGYFDVINLDFETIESDLHGE